MVKMESSRQELVKKYIKQVTGTSGLSENTEVIMVKTLEPYMTE